MREPLRHRAMVEAGITRRTYWRRTAAEFHLGEDNDAWVDVWGHTYGWSDLPKHRRLVFKGEKR